MDTNTAPETNGAGVRPDSSGLKRSMGLWMATALVVGNMIGSGVFLLPAAMAGTAGPVSMLGVASSPAIGAILLALVFATLGRAYPTHRRAVRLRPQGVRRLRRLPDRVELLDRRLGRQRRDRVAFVGYLTVFWGDRLEEPARGARRHRAHLAPDLRQHPRRPRGRQRPGRDDRPQVRPAARDRRRRAVLHRRRQLRALHASQRLRLGHQRRGPADALGLHRPGVGDRPGRGGQGPRADDPARDDHRHGRRRPSLYIVATSGDHGHHRQLGARGLDAARSPTPPNVIFGGGWDKVIAIVAMVSTFGALNGWILLQGRVPLGSGPATGSSRGRSRGSHGKRRTPVFGLVVSSVLVTGLMLMNYTKLRDDRRHVHGRHPARHADDAGALRCTRRRRRLYLVFAERELVLRRPPRARLGDRVPRASPTRCWAICGAGYDVIAKGFMLLLAGIPVYVVDALAGSRAASPRPAAPGRASARLRPSGAAVEVGRGS